MSAGWHTVPIDVAGVEGPSRVKWMTGLACEVAQAGFLGEFCAATGGAQAAKPTRLVSLRPRPSFSELGDLNQFQRNNPERDVCWFFGWEQQKISPTGLFMAFRGKACYDRPDREYYMQTITDSESFGLLIRKERKTQKLTQEQLAGLTGVGVRFVRELEAGKGSCQIGRALRVAASLGLALSVGSRREGG